VIEPEHLKGLIEVHLVNQNHIPVEIVKYGNHVEDTPKKIMNLLNAEPADVIEPADPASVAGEEDAAEKRKILEVGRQVSGV